MRNQYALQGENIPINTRIIDVNALLSVRRDKNNSTELLQKTNNIIPSPMMDDELSS